MGELDGCALDCAKATDGMAINIDSTIVSALFITPPHPSCVASEKFGSSSIPKAARSAPRNIAEGFGQYKHRFEEAQDSGHLADVERHTPDHMAKKAIKAANGLIRYLESTPDP